MGKNTYFAVGRRKMIEDKRICRKIEIREQLVMTMAATAAQ